MAAISAGGMMLPAPSDFAHYRIESCIGSGAVGTVYVAEDRRLGRRVALKVVNEDLAGSEGFRGSLAQEARKAAQVDSPYVVRVWEYAEHEGCPYISLEYVPGPDLRAWSHGRSLTEKTALAEKLIEGVRAAHDRGLVHRDLKPENIKVTASGDPRVLDFGLAINPQTDVVDASGDIAGTVLYASPEQVSGELVTDRSDLFSLGVVLYEMLVGKRPFEGAYSAAILYSILHEDPIPPRELDDSIPEWLEAMVLRLLAKDPVQRFGSARETLEYLRSHVRAPGSTAIAPHATRRKTVTVLTIENLSGDSSWDYFCTGFTRDLMRETARRTDLLLTEQPSPEHCGDIQRVFEHCRSDFALTGTLLKWQNRMRVSLSIYQQHDSRLIFGEKFEGPSEDLFAILSEAAEAAAEALAQAVGSASIEVEDYLAADVSAYDCYLKGRDYYQTNKPEDLNLAAAMFTRALEADPDFALAHTGLSDVYAFRYMAYYDRTRECIEAARREAEAALHLNANLPEAHRSLGRYHMFIGDFAGARETFMKAVQIDPRFAVGYRTLAWLAEMQGDLAEALGWAKRALALAPTDLETLLLISLVYLDQRKFTLALATLQRTVELGPDYGKAYYNLGAVYTKLGVFDLALENMLLAIKYKGDINCFIDAGYLHMIRGEYPEAVAKFEASVQAGHLGFIAHYYLGFLEQLQGRTENARTYLQHTLADCAALEREDPDNVHVLSIKALALAALGESQQSASLLERIENRCAGQGEALYNVARCRAVLGDRTKSQELIGRAMLERAGPTEKEIAVDPHLRSGSVT